MKRSQLKKGTTKLSKELKEAKNEKDVEVAYKTAIKKALPNVKITSPYNTDGILEDTDLHTLLEFKHKKAFSNKRFRCEAILQTVHYLHNIMVAKDKIPTTVFIGDSEQCFWVRTEVLADLMRKNIDWMVAPSQCAGSNHDLLTDMVNSETFDDFLIFNVHNVTFRLKDLFPLMKEMDRNSGKPIKLTPDNIFSAFQYFSTDVVIDTKENLKGDEHTRVNRMGDIFFNCLTDRKTTMPNKNGDISTRGEVIHVSTKMYNAFIKLFELNSYSISEKELLVAMKDQVLEEMNRRMTGAYFTPDLWIAKAHEMIAEQFGTDWKEKYVVWDCASGTNNLTRRHRFKELYNSTLELGDVDTVKDMNYPGKTFQYNFLDDDDQKLKEKCPHLFKALTEKKPIMFLINPPYGTSNGKMAGKGENKAGISNTTIMNIAMKNEKMGACSDQLYAQFLYRILMLKKEYGLTDIKICFFSTPLFMTGEGFTKFRTTFYNNFNFKDGMLFQADQFADVSGGWGISFTVWGEKQCN